MPTTADVTLSKVPQPYFFETVEGEVVRVRDGGVGSEQMHDTHEQTRTPGNKTLAILNNPSHP